MRSAAKILMILLTCIVSGKLLKAEPLFIQFDEMMQRTSCIAVGTFLGYDGKTADESFTYYFKVDQYLKTGQLKTKLKGDTLELKRAHGTVYLNPGTRCIAFINENGEFEWYGVTKNQTISDQSLVFIEGFYDWNAYIVSPAMLSVGQLKEFIATESYHGSVYGDIHFFSNATQQMETSPLKVEVTYSYKNNIITSEVFLNGINLNDFKNKPNFELPWHYEEVTIEYQPNLSRPLELKGKILDIHPSETRMHCYFWVEEPEELTYDEFVEFMNDPHKGHPYYELQVEMQNTSKDIYSVIIHDEIGRVGKLIGYGKTTIPISSLSTSPSREIVFDDGEKNITITFDSILVDKSIFEFAGDDLIRELKIRPVNASVTLQPKDATRSTPLGKCKVSYKATHFAKY